MRVAVLCVWLITASLGGYLATVWIRHGGLQQRTPGVTRLPLWLVLGHIALAVAGLPPGRRTSSATRAAPPGPPALSS